MWTLYDFLPSGNRYKVRLTLRAESHEYLVDDRFSIADIALYAYVHSAAEGGFELAPFGALRRWFARIEARPAYLPLGELPR